MPSTRLTTRSGRQTGKRVSFAGDSQSESPPPTTQASSSRSKGPKASKAPAKTAKSSIARAPKEKTYTEREFRRELNKNYKRTKEDLEYKLQSDYQFEERDRQIRKERAEAPYQYQLQLDLVRKQVNIKARQSLVPLWNIYVGLTKKDELDVASLKNQLEEARQKHNLLGDCFFVAHLNPKAKDARQFRLDSIDDFNSQVSKAMEDYHRLYPSKEMDLRLQCLAFPSPVNPEAEG